MKTVSGIGWRLLCSRPFALLWSSQAVAQIGDGVIKVALLWFVYTLTGSALKMTVIGLLQTIPPLVLGPLIGVYLDRMRKKPVMIWADLARAPLIATIPVLQALDLLTLPWLYLLVFLIAVAATIFAPAMVATVPVIVNRSELTAANALIQSTATIGVLVGPAISGPGIALIGAHNVLYFGAVAFVLSGLLLVPVRAAERVARAEDLADWRSCLRDLRTGLRVVFLHHRVLRLLIVTAGLHSFAASAFVFLLPVYSTEVLLAGSVELGWLWGVYGAGMLTASVWLAMAKDRSPGDRLMLLSVVMAAGAGAALGFVVTSSFLITLPAIAIIGGSVALLTPIVWGLLQELTPADLRGRVFSLFSSAAMFSAILGMMAFGWLADLAGAIPSFIAMACFLLATGLMVLRLRQVQLAVPQERLREPRVAG